jgi:predicted transcriptional regulator
LEELYEAWEHNTSCLLNQISREQGWNKDEFEVVVKMLRDKYLIEPRNGGWNFKATSKGVLYIEKQGVVSKERSSRNRQARNTILQALAKLRTEHGRDERIHIKKLCSNEGIDVMLCALNADILRDEGLIRSIGQGSYQITDEGMRRVSG